VTWQEIIIATAFLSLLISTLIAAWTGQRTISQQITLWAWHANSFAAFLGLMLAHWTFFALHWKPSLLIALSPVLVFGALDIVNVWLPFPKWTRRPETASLIGWLFGALFYF